MNQNGDQKKLNTIETLSVLVGRETRETMRTVKTKRYDGERSSEESCAFPNLKVWEREGALVKRTICFVSRYSLFLAAILACCFAARGAEPTASPTPPLYPIVLQVQRGTLFAEPTRDDERDQSQTRNVDMQMAGRGDAVWIWVQHLYAWMQEKKKQDSIPQNAKVADLVPFLDDVPLKGIHPEQSWPNHYLTDSEDNPQVHYLRFILRRTEASKDAWTQILNRPNFTRQMKVSVGFENGEEMLTKVTPTATEQKINSFSR